ncbi:MAG TPA: UPF0158 family protein [Aridibacter sp.]|nr:UPF0158 family protein [Aridibacter sp.]
MSRMIIDGDLLTDALVYDFGDNEHFLDNNTGKVLFLTEEALFTDDGELDPEEVDLESEQYTWIDPRPSNESWKVMADFTENHTDGEVFEDLARALRGGKPFRSFKDALLRYPDVRENWFAYEEAEMIEYARKWLAAEGIDADIEYRGKIIKGLPPIPYEPTGDDEEE